MNTPEHLRLVCAADLDALVGLHIMGEMPEVFWEDAHGVFQFATEGEVREAIEDPYYQSFLQAVEWEETIVRQVRQFPSYCGDPKIIWKVVARASQTFGPLRLQQEAGRWRASFGAHAEVPSRTAAVAICLAALQACGLTLQVEHDRIDAELNRLPGSVPEPRHDAPVNAAGPDQR